MLLFHRPAASAEAVSDPRSAVAVAPAPQPSALLAHIAGEFASDIARVWPAPHTPFLLAEASRRHLVCLALAMAREGAVSPGPAFVAQALEASLKRAIAALLPGAPAGLARALGHLGETAWTAADYGLLLARLAEPQPAKLLRHAGAITPAAVQVISALPPMLQKEGGLPLQLTADQGRLVAECLRGIIRRDGPDHAARLAREWAASRTAKALFDRVQEDIRVSRAPSFHPGTERLRPLDTVAAMQDAARRYRNCLKDRDLGETYQYFEWIGPPGVVVCVMRDALWGWVLDEGRMVNNEPAPALLQTAIAADLRAMGVHVGTGVWALDNALRRATKDDFRFGDEAASIAWAFGD